jgi:hypothetical protein
MHPSKRLRDTLAILSLLTTTSCIFDETKTSPSNNSPIVQPELSPGASIDRDIPVGTTSAKDSVRIAFAADSGKTYRLIVADSTSSLALHVENLDSVRQFSSFAMDFSKKTTIIDFPCAKTGMYYMVVTGKPGAVVRVSQTVREGLPTSFVAADGFEPDSTMHTASAIPADGNWNQRTCTSGLVGDVDWYFTPTLPGHTYAIEFKDTVVLYGGARSLWDADSNRIGLPTTSSLSYSSFETGRIWFRTDCDPSGNRYKLRVTETVGYPSGSTLPDAFETDDSLHSPLAKADSGFTARTMHGLSTSKDTDWTRFEVTGGRSWTVAVWDTTVSIGSRLSGLPAGIAATSTFSGAKGRATLTTWTFPSLASGIVTLRTTGSKAGGYALQAWASGPLPDSIRMPDAWETDSKNRPTPLKTDSQFLSRNFHGVRTSGDTDWIALDLDSGRTYFLCMRDSSGTIDGEWMGIPEEISIEDAGTTNLGKTGYATIASFPSIAKGRLLIQLRDSLAVGYSIAAWSHPGLPDSLLPERGEPDNTFDKAFEVRVDSSTVIKRVARRDTDWVSASNPSGAGAVLRVKNLGGGTLAWRPSIDATTRQIPSGRTDSVTILSPNPRRILAQIWNTDTTGPRIQYALEADSIKLPPDALEPDDASTAPSVVAQGADFVQRWSSPDDTDWMVLDLPVGLAAKVYWIGDATAKLAAFSASLLPLTALAPEKRGDTLVQYLTNSGKILLRATSISGIAKYRVRIDTATLDPDETSTHRSAPLEATFDSAGTKLWIPAGDTDWLRLKTRPGGYYLFSDLPYVSVSLEFAGSEAKPEARLFGWSGWTAPSAGELLFRLVGTGTTNSALPVATAFKVREIMTDSLVGDSLHPVAFAADGSTITRIQGKRTIRWMAAPVVAGLTYAFGSGSSIGTVSIDIYADGKEVGSGWSGSTKATWTANADGLARIRLESRSTSLVDPPDTTRFSLLEWKPEAGEPNNDTLHATPLRTDSTIYQAYLESNSDEDYYQFQVEPDRIYSMWIDNPNGFMINFLDYTKNISLNSSTGTKVDLLVSNDGSGHQIVNFGRSATSDVFRVRVSSMTTSLTPYKVTITSHPAP